MPPSPWCGEGFNSHRGGTDITFYHVYDHLSQTPYVRGRGIQCSAKNNLEAQNVQQIVTYPRLYEHLRWDNRNMTPFISLFNDRESANRSALFRAKNRNVCNKLTDSYDYRNASSIRIAEISSWELDQHAVHYFSTKKLKNHLDLEPEQAIWKRVVRH